MMALTFFTNGTKGENTVKAKAPCYGCQTRSERCHSDCGKYLEYKTERDNRRAERSKNYDFNDYICHKIDLNTRGRK